MKSRALIVLGCVALAGAGTAYLLRSAVTPASAPERAVGTTVATGGKPASLPAPHSNVPAVLREPGPVTLQTERDAEAVFQRAFWRRPGPDVRILDGERRDWADGDNVRQWQWFLAVQTTPEFRQWLLEQNPFEVVRAETPLEPARTEQPAPAWFPETAARTRMTQYRKPGAQLALYLEPVSGRRFATDAGAGFAAPVHR